MRGSARRLARLAARPDARGACAGGTGFVLLLASNEDAFLKATVKAGAFGGDGGAES
jgi:hypothetical protein